MRLALTVLLASCLFCSEPTSTIDAPEWPVDTVLVRVHEDSTAMGSCTICNSQIVIPYYSDYEWCVQIAREQGMSICRWAQLDRVPEEWD